VNEEESLSELEARLNREMKCPMGKNQVYIHGSIIRASDGDPPEIRLRCKLRTMRGDRDPIGLAYIEKVCTRNPKLCPSYRSYYEERGQD